MTNYSDQQIFEMLYEKAKEAFDNAYAPYSHFKVGASLLTKDGKIINGCNVENSSYGLSICAERTCLFKAYSKGIRKDDIVCFLILAETNRPVSPCGACRQVMTELMNLNTKVYLTNLMKDTITYTCGDLLPYSFNSDDLKYE